jgi:hypothetical protein
MSIKFTKHALERMKLRAITKEEIIDTINNPEKEINDSFGNIIVSKIKKKYLLEFFTISKKIQKLS